MLKAFLLIVVGLAGDPEHGKTFHKWGTSLAEASERLGVTKDRLVYLVDQPGEGRRARLGPRDARRDRRRRSRLRQAGRSRGRRLHHAHRPRRFDGRTRSSICRRSGHDRSGFNLLLQAAGQAGRVRQHHERERTVHRGAVGAGPHDRDRDAQRRRALHARCSAGYFIDALTSEAADADKNKRVSVLEAFKFAKAEVARAYEREGLLATEHALLDDDGDKEGSADPWRRARIRRTRTARWRRWSRSASPATTGCRPIRSCARCNDERRDLERRVESLRLLKESMDPAKYTSELEKLVTAIALKTREIRAAEGGPNPSQRQSARIESECDRMPGVEIGPG